MRLYGLSGPVDSAGVAGQWGAVARFRRRDNSHTGWTNIELLFGSLDGVMLTAPQYSSHVVQWCEIAGRGLEYVSLGGMPVLVPILLSATATTAVTCHEYRAAVTSVHDGVSYTMAGMLLSPVGLCNAHTNTSCNASLGVKRPLVHLMQLVERIGVELKTQYTVACDMLLYVSGKRADKMPLFGSIAIKQADVDRWHAAILRAGRNSTYVVDTTSQGGGIAMRVRYSRHSPVSVVVWTVPNDVSMKTKWKRFGDAVVAAAEASNEGLFGAMTNMCIDCESEVCFKFEHQSDHQLGSLLHSSTQQCLALDTLKSAPALEPCHFAVTQLLFEFEFPLDLKFRAGISWLHGPFKDSCESGIFVLLYCFREMPQQVRTDFDPELSFSKHNIVIQYHLSEMRRLPVILKECQQVTIDSFWRYDDQRRLFVHPGFCH